MVVLKFEVVGRTTQKCAKENIQTQEPNLSAGKQSIGMWCRWTITDEVKTKIQAIRMNRGNILGDSGPTLEIVKINSE